MQAETYGSRSLRLRAAVILLVLFAALGMAGFNVIAQDAPTGFDPMTATNDLTIMRAEAARSGSLRVIVGVNANTASLNGLDGAAYDAGFAFESITAQNRVLAAVTSGRANVQVNRQYDFIPFMALTVDAAGLDALAANPMVASIETDSLAMVDMNSSLPIIGASGVGGAWDLGFTGKGFAVAVLDTGVDKGHPALTGAVVSEACYNTPSAQYGSTSRCPGGQSASVAPGSGKDCASASSVYGCGHGTHVAGTVASRNATFRGVAPDAKIIAINVFSKFSAFNVNCPTSSPCVISYTSDQVAAMNRVYTLRTKYKIAAINMSLGGGQFSTQAQCNAANGSRKNAIEKLRNANIATVVASGNSYFKSSMGAPACISGAVSVGATYDNDTVTEFSNSANFLALLAPGFDITSATSGTNGFHSLNGTSMATPHVAGAWAVLRQGKPGATVTKVLNVLKSTGEDVTDTNPGASNRVTPRIQLNAALLELAPPAAPTNVTAPAINDTVIAVKWKKVGGASGYTIERSPNGTSSWVEVGSKGKTGTSFVNSGLICNTTYFFRVIAWNQEIEGNPSAVVDQSTKECVIGTELLVNGSFEDNDAAPVNVPDSWKKGGSLLGDKVINNAAKAHGGTNSFQFTGNVGESGSMISQDVLVDSIDQGELLLLSVFLDQQTASPGVVIGKLIIKYSDGTPTKQLTLKTPPVKSPDYVRVMTNGYIVPNNNVSKVTVQLLYNASGGKFSVDDASLRVATAPGISLPASGSGVDLRGQ